MFDLEVVKHMCHYKVVDGKLVIRREDRIEWEQSGSSEFNEFLTYVCALPHVKALADTNHELDLLPIHNHTVLKRFKTTMQKIFWMGLASCIKGLFLDDKCEVASEFR